jgi:hypothetical protein
MRRRRTGTEPVTARSALGPRTWLAAFGVLACAVATVVIGSLALDRSGSDRVVLTVLALVALLGVIVGVVDLLVLSERRRHSGPR